MPRAPERAVRDLADAYVASLADLDPVLATMLGLESGAQSLPDLSPAGYQAQDELARTTLAELNQLTNGAAPTPDAERHCARQLGTWTALAGELSAYQTSAGSVSAMTEGWALYAERLMDELGYLADPGTRLGYPRRHVRPEVLAHSRALARRPRSRRPHRRAGTPVTSSAQRGIVPHGVIQA